MNWFFIIEKNKTFTYIELDDLSRKNDKDKNVYVIKGEKLFFQIIYEIDKYDHIKYIFNIFETDSF